MRHVNHNPYNISYRLYCDNHLLLFVYKNDNSKIYLRFLNYLFSFFYFFLSCWQSIWDIIVSQVWLSLVLRINLYEPNLTTRKGTMENDNLNAINSHNFVNYQPIVVHKTTHTRCSKKRKRGEYEIRKLCNNNWQKR